MANPSTEHVTRASSDQLLHKFAELDSDKTRRSQLCKLQMMKGPVVLRRKRSKRVASGLGAREIVVTGDLNYLAAKRRRSSGSLAGEWKALLPPPSRRSKPILRRLGMGKAEAGTAVLLAALEKTWRKTVEGASKIFIKKHCSTHIRLTSDIV